MDMPLDILQLYIYTPSMIDKQKKHAEWAKIKEDMLAMKAAGMSDQEIANKRDRSYNTIRTLFRKWRLAAKKEADKRLVGEQPQNV